jgi:hypothetical protein
MCSVPEIVPASDCIRPSATHRQPRRQKKIPCNHKRSQGVLSANSVYETAEKCAADLLCPTTVPSDQQPALLQLRNRLQSD